MLRLWGGFSKTSFGGFGFRVGSVGFRVFRA